MIIPFLLVVITFVIFHFPIPTTIVHSQKVSCELKLNDIQQFKGHSYAVLLVIDYHHKTAVHDKLYQHFVINTLEFLFCLFYHEMVCILRKRTNNLKKN